MVNISIFRSPIEKPVLDKEKPEIIRRVVNSQSKFFETKVKDSQYQRSQIINNKRGKEYEQQL